MNDKQFEQTQQRIRGIFERLVEALGLGDVRFDLMFHRDPPHGLEDGSMPTMEIAPSRVYGHALVQVYASSVLEMDDDHVAEAALHEINHYAIHPISRYGASPEYDALEELVCTDLARMQMALIKATGDEVAEHWRKRVKQLEKELKQMAKHEAAVA